MIDEAVCDFGMGAQWRHSAATAKSTHREVGNLPETYARFETVSYIHTFISLFVTVASYPSEERKY